MALITINIFTQGYPLPRRLTGGKVPSSNCSPPASRSPIDLAYHERGLEAMINPPIHSVCHPILFGSEQSIDEVLSLIGFAPSETPGQIIDGDWVINETEVVENQVITLNGNLIVEPGANLTLINVTLYMNSPPWRPYWSPYCVWVKKNGVLKLLNGTVITSSNSSNYGPHISIDGGNLVMHDSRLIRCAGLRISVATASISDSVIEDLCTGIDVWSSNFTMCNTQVIDSGGVRALYMMLVSLCREGCRVSLHSNQLVRDNWYSLFCYIYAPNTMLAMINNTFTGAAGIMIYGSSAEILAATNIIAQDNVINGRPLVILANVSNVEITGELGGILILSSANVRIIDAVVPTYICYPGCVFIDHSSNVAVENCVLNASVLCRESNVIFADNQVTGRLYLRNAGFSTITNNTFMDRDAIGIFINGDRLEHFKHDIRDNTVNGRPLYYIFGGQNVVVTGDVGSVLLVNCTHMTISNIYDAGVLIAFSNDAVVEGGRLGKFYCTRSHKVLVRDVLFTRGAAFGCSYNVTVECCEILSCRIGVFAGSSQINIVGSIFKNNLLALRVYNASVTLKLCMVMNNTQGIYVSDSWADLHWSNITGNEQYGLLGYASTINATYNWWGSPSGPELLNWTAGAYRAYGDPESPEEIVIRWGTQITYEPWLSEPVPKHALDLTRARITITTTTSSTYVGLVVSISGRLVCGDNQPIGGVDVIISYSPDRGRTWYIITTTTTDENGTYFAQWVPTATGDMLLKATASHKVRLFGVEVAVVRRCAIISLSILPYQARYVFSVISNSTIYQLAFNSTSKVLSFMVSGPSGTVGFCKVIISKDLVANATDIQVYLDGNRLNYTISSTEDSWILYFTYLHSTHRVAVRLDTRGPLIMGVSWLPEEPEEGQDVTIRANITDSSDIAEVTLLYSTDGGGSWREIPMQSVGGSLYEASIPGQPAGTTVIFKIRARDSVGNESMSSEYSYTVKAKPSPGPTPQPSPPSLTRGIPLGYLAVATVVIMIMVVILLVRRRKVS